MIETCVTAFPQSRLCVWVCIQVTTVLSTLCVIYEECLGSAMDVVLITFAARVVIIQAKCDNIGSLNLPR